MQTHIQNWGNSLGIRIPKHLAKRLHLFSGSIVNLEIEDGRIIIQAPQYNLELMLKEITKKKSHHQQLEDKQVGNEAW